MTLNTVDTDRLRALDPQSQAPLDPMDRARQDALHLRVVSDAALRPVQRPRSRRPLLFATGGLVAACALTVAVVVAGSLASRPNVTNYALSAKGALSTWTSTPVPATPTGALNDACVQARSSDSAPNGVQVYTTEVRGAFTTQLMQVDGETGYCISTESTGARWLPLPTDITTVGPPLASDQVNELWGQGASPWDDSGDLVVVGGLIGDDVTGLRVNLVDGSYVTATVNDGHWSAWWPLDPPSGGAIRPVNTFFGDSIDYTTSDGVTHHIASW